MSVTYLGITGKPALIAEMSRALRRLADGEGGPELREMARQVLTGRVDLRTAMSSSAYDQAISARLTGFGRWYTNLTPEQRDAVVAAGETHLGTSRDATPRNATLRDATPRAPESTR